MNPAEVIRKMIDAFNANAREAFLACYSPTVAVDEGQSTEGTYGPAVAYDGVKAALPDARFEAKYLIEQGDICAGEMLLTGTHTGTVLPIPEGNLIREIPATGKSVRVPYAEFARVVNDHIVSDNTYGIVAGLMEQLDVTTLPAPAVQKMYQAMNAGDKAAYMATVSPDVVMDEGQPTERRAEEAWSGDWDGLKTAFPDINVEITDSITVADRCAIQAIVTGTHTGRFVVPPGLPVREVAPTGKSIHLDVSMFYRLKDGLIVSEEAYGWATKILIQLGAVGAPTAAV